METASSPKKRVDRANVRHARKPAKRKERPKQSFQSCFKGLIAGDTTVRPSLSGSIPVRLEIDLQSDGYTLEILLSSNAGDATVRLSSLVWITFLFENDRPLPWHFQRFSESQLPVRPLYVSRSSCRFLFALRLTGPRCGSLTDFQRIHCKRGHSTVCNHRMEHC